MDTMDAFQRNLDAKSRGAEQMVFDWDRAARRIVETGCRSAYAGLCGDWEWTGGEILRDGKPLKREETYTFLASNHATPELEIDGVKEDCFLMSSQSDDWGSETFWPASALAILGSSNKSVKED